ncbi:DUF7286 family protein [Halopenitus malekzadehii]|uniref:DUF7286 family protein n=1 Tax=Halopenitus malekzadehii TaxID=1267564 RepID=UPI000B80DA7F|nr:hypothetical protein [Halopenitus malekzadehii]
MRASDRPAISIAEDRRGRVPFALVGVLLLVSSTAYASGLATTGVTVDRSVEWAMDRASADLTPTLRSATAEAARTAAAQPVTRPDPALAGTVIRNESAFEDALRVRIGLAVVESIDTATARAGDVHATTTVSFDDPVPPAHDTIDPPKDDVATLAEVRDGVTIAPAANGTALAATVHNVTTTARRNGRIVGERTRDVTVVVPVPVLAAHERTERFERVLNRGALEGPGLGRQLTGRLYAIAWARGYAQRFGTPVQNVVGNRHVELSTNAGVTAVQRETFGAADPNASAGVRRAAVRTGLTDLLEPTSLDEGEWSRFVLETSVPDPDDATETASGTAATVMGDGNVSGTSGDDATDAAGTNGIADATGVNDAADADETTETVTAGPAADAALVETLDRTGSIAKSAYRVEATREVRTDRIGGQPSPPSRRSPGANWTYVGDRTTSTADASGSGGEDGFETATRRVTVDHRTTRYWTDGSSQRTTTVRWSQRYRVTVAVDGRYAPSAGAPDRPTSPTFERGGAIDGPNLRDTPTAARRDLDATTVDSITERAVESGVETPRRTVVYGDRPADLGAWMRDDIAVVHETVRGVETTVEMREVAAGEANPYGELAATVRAKRHQLIDAPRTYDGAADRARVAARRAYVDATIAKLEQRARTAREVHADAEEAAATETRNDGDASTADGSSLGEYIAASGRTTDTDPYEIGESGPGGAVSFQPAGSPGYLPRTTIDAASPAADPGSQTRPLVTRNVNVFTVPYGDVAGGIVDEVLDLGSRVPLPQAGRTLAATERTLRETDDHSEELRRSHDRLESDVAGSVERVERRVEHRLGGVTDLSGSERRAVVDAAGDHYATTGSLAAAVGNGQYAETIVAEVAHRTTLTDGERARLAAETRTTLRSAIASGRTSVSKSRVTSAGEITRKVARKRIESAVEDELRRTSGEAVDRLGEEHEWATEVTTQVGAGLPVAPVPGYWYATVNVWHVDVAGTYPRFVLRSDTGPPGKPFEYVRESGRSTVAVDGERVTLGYTDPIRFETGTTVVVAVPPGPPGVGDVDGTWSERSPGWPCPGPERRECSAGSG